MKKRTKAEAAAAMRASRARKKAQKAVTPAGSSPIVAVTPVTPVTPAPVSCPNCVRLLADLQQARAEVARLQALVGAKVDLPYRPSIDRPPAHRQEGKELSMDDAEVLRQRVIAEKVSRINTLGNGHVIGTVRR